MWFSFLFYLSPSCLSLRPPLPLSRGSLDAEQTQCSLCKITRLIKANKQTTALRQLQMKANLYTINKRRSSFNLPMRPAHCSPPPFFSTSSTHPLLHPPVCSLSQSLLCCWAGLKDKENWLTHWLFIDHPFFLSLYLLFSGFLCNALCVYRACVKVFREESLGMEKCAARDWVLVWLAGRGVVIRESRKRRLASNSSLSPWPVFCLISSTARF